jgi:D-lactate dehydrogenase
MALLTPDIERLAPPITQAAHDRAPDWVAEGTPEPLRSGLIDALGRDRVLTRALDLVKYASDASPYRMIPRAVVTPRDVTDVVALLAFASRTETPLVFRAGGTSLNGQAQTDSVLIDVRRHWQHARVEEDGRRVRVQPGMVLGHVNRLLARHGRRLGPDPASTDICCVGGVIANNSGGMRCGVVADSYRTVRSMTFVLANGAVIDTAAPGAEDAFARAAPELAAGLIQIRDELRGDEQLAERVRRKFQIKNTTGYRLCAFLDGDTPLEIFRRAIIGSEGTLAFVAEAVFETVPFGRHTRTGMLIFENVDAAAEAVPPLVESGASATELLVAPTLIAAAYNMPGVPERWKELAPEYAALLVEYRSDDPDELEDQERAALQLLDGRALVEPPRFSGDPDETRMFWHVREGLHGLMAAMRPPGAMLLMEDVCVPPARVAEAAKDIPDLLRKHGFLWGVAGHASAGNLHFTLTPNFDRPADLDRYEAFMHDLVELIVGKYDGSLKAEHGTGMNMAPYVEREWGPRATEMMWRVKRLADPLGILAPGIVLNRDPGVHLRNLKSIPEIEEVATKCIECGACEPVCPSRNVTTTPRQRIVLRREMARQPDGSPVRRALLEQYEYDALQTCAADGTCGPACPVGIDTGKLVKQLRGREHSERAERAGVAVARRSASVERAARAALHLPLGAWRASIPSAAPARLPFTVREGAAAIYLPACVNRMFGNPRGAAAHPTVPEAMVAISQRAGLPLWIPPDVAGHCCGLPWSSKGFEQGNELMSQKTTSAIARWSAEGELPVVLDASSCTHALRDAGAEVLDSIEWVHDHLLDRLDVPRRLGTITAHPNCSAGHLGLGGKLAAIASAMADEVLMPAFTSCCGAAGDRGWLHPELPASALRDVARELDGHTLDACVSSNRTCEAALQEVTGRDYRSFVLVLEELTRP